MEDFYVSVDEVCDQIYEMLECSTVVDYVEVFGIHRDALREDFAEVCSQILNADVVSTADNFSVLDLGEDRRFLVEYENDVSSTIFKISVV
jgi:hypothetical protein